MPFNTEDPIDVDTLKDIVSAFREMKYKADPWSPRHVGVQGCELPEECNYVLCFGLAEKTAKDGTKYTDIERFVMAANDYKANGNKADPTKAIRTKDGKYYIAHRIGSLVGSLSMAKCMDPKTYGNPYKDEGLKPSARNTLHVDIDPADSYGVRFAESYYNAFLDFIIDQVLPVSSESLQALAGYPYAPREKMVSLILNNRSSEGTKFAFPVKFYIPDGSDQKFWSINVGHRLFNVVTDKKVNVAEHNARYISNADVDPENTLGGVIAAAAQKNNPITYNEMKIVDFSGKKMPYHKTITAMTGGFPIQFTVVFGAGGYTRDPEKKASQLSGKVPTQAYVSAELDNGTLRLISMNSVRSKTSDETADYSSFADQIIAKKRIETMASSSGAYEGEMEEAMADAGDFFADEEDEEDEHQDKRARV